MAEFKRRIRFNWKGECLEAQDYSRRYDHKGRFMYV